MWSKASKARSCTAFQILLDLLGGHNGEDVKYVYNFIIVIDMHKSYIKRKYLIIL